MRHGIDADLEAAADALIFAVTKVTTKQSDKADVLTPWKEEWRRSHEVYATTGTPQPHVRQGTFTRVYNRQAEHLNSREGVAGNYRRAGTGHLSADMLLEGNPQSLSGGGHCTGHWQTGPTSCTNACLDART